MVHEFPKTMDLIEPVEVTILSLSFNASTHNIDFDLSAKFYDDYSGDIRFDVSIVEYSVYHPGDPDYLQSCYSGPDYLHKHVLRDMLDGTDGIAAVIPTTVPN